MRIHIVVVGAFLASYCAVRAADTFPPLAGANAPQSLAEAWGDFDPTAEPLDVELLHEWEAEGVVLQVVRFRIGVFKGQKSMLAAVFGYPKAAADNQQRIPGLVQIHGGGQYADAKACLTNARRGYATVSIAWAGRISTPEYRVTPAEVQLFWDRAIDNPRYRPTTDWGALDGYHAPGRHQETVYPSAKATEWTIDPIESPRNSPWFLSAIAARRALTFLEAQPVVDPTRLGVYGHSMGGKLTVMASGDERVKAAAPSCGGISDRYNRSDLFTKTICDQHSLEQISCPIAFLSPANDFHGRIGDLPAAVNEVRTNDWRVICSPHSNHQDTGAYEVATQLWFDQHLKKTFTVPATPTTSIDLDSSPSTVRVDVEPDRSRLVKSIDVYYTQDGRPIETPADRDNTVSRFWRHMSPEARDGKLSAALPLVSDDKPVWVYANVTYGLDEPIAAAGYYYRDYETAEFVISSLIKKVSAEQIAAAGIEATIAPSLMIETFEPGWEQHWFSYQPESWPRTTHKVYDPQWKAPDNARLGIAVRSSEANELVVVIDQHAAAVSLEGGGVLNEVALSLSDFKNADEAPLASWTGIRSLKLTDEERLRSPGGDRKRSRTVGRRWIGAAPNFSELRWLPE